jgi:hypothetical protein
MPRLWYQNIRDVTATRHENELNMQTQSDGGELAAVVPKGPDSPDFRHAISAGDKELTY